MKLSDLLPEFCSTHDAKELASADIVAVTDDSRQVGPNSLFFAISGLTVDGHDFAEKAAARGAVAVVCSRPLSLGVPSLVVQDVPKALGLAAARLHGDPCQALDAVGITGTNGKTTTAYLLEGILSGAGHRPGVVGTVSYRFAGQERPAAFTTPTPVQLQELLGEMVSAGCDQLVMEVSSHGLSLGRVWGCSYNVAAFSHLSQDHLDLHESMDAYLKAKLLLFSRYLVAGGKAVVNIDGLGGNEVMQIVERRGDVQLLRCSRQQAEAELHIEGLRCDIRGLSGELLIGNERLALRSTLLGEYNADNLLLAAGCAVALGVSPQRIAEGVAELSGVPGRLERVDDAKHGYAVLVDYAHTPDALERAIAALRPLCSGRLITAFGCGGDRDRDKRPLMGEAVARGADLAVVTSDNPRKEDPQVIIEQILPGITRQGLPAIDTLETPAGYWVEADRARAIATSVEALRPGDILLIAGKGHEDYQILGSERLHFDDREHARQALAKKEH